MFVADLWANMVSSRIGRTPSNYRKICSSLRRSLTSSACTCPHPAAAVVLCVDEKSGVQALRPYPAVTSHDIR